MRSGGIVSVEGSFARAQSLRRLRENVLELARNEGPTSFSVCSAAPRGGKSITVAGLAVGLAESGASVIAVDADRGGLSVASALGASGLGAGLAEVLAGRVAAEAVAIELEAPLGHLFLLRPGESDLTPDSLGGSISRRLFEHVSERFDYVLTNVPPLLEHADAIDLVRLAGGVLLVLRDDAVTQREAEDVRVALERAALKIRGVVLTDTGEAPDRSIRPAELRGRLLSGADESRTRDVDARTVDVERQAQAVSERESALTAAETQAAERARLLTEQEARLAAAAEEARAQGDALARREQELAETREVRARELAEQEARIAEEAERAERELRQAVERAAASAAELAGEAARAAEELVLNQHKLDERAELLAAQEARVEAEREELSKRHMALKRALAERAREPAEAQAGEADPTASEHKLVLNQHKLAGADEHEELGLAGPERRRLAELEQVAEELATVDPGRAEELGFYLEGLRQVVDPGGLLPGSVEALVLEAFAGLLPE